MSNMKHICRVMVTMRHLVRHVLMKRFWETKLENRAVCSLLLFQIAIRCSSIAKNYILSNGIIIQCHYAHIERWLPVISAFIHLCMLEPVFNFLIPMFLQHAYKSLLTITLDFIYLSLGFSFLLQRTHLNLVNLTYSYIWPMYELDKKKL